MKSAAKIVLSFDMCKQTGKFLRKMFILQNKNRIFFSYFIAGKMPAYLFFQLFSREERKRRTELATMRAQGDF